MKCKICLYLIVGLVLTSCGKQPMYIKTYDFSDHTWGGGESPEFKFRTNDTKNAYNFVLTLRTTTDYEYSNLWVFMYTKSPNKKIRKDTLNFPIAEPNGKWIGENSGSIVENEFLIGFNKKFPAKGKYTIWFEQAIMQKEVNNVLDLTFEVSKTATQ